MYDLLSVLLLLCGALLYFYREAANAWIVSVLSSVLLTVARDPSASVLVGMIVTLVSSASPASIKMYGSCKVISIKDAQGAEYFIPLPFDRRKKLLTFKMDDGVKRYYPKGVEFYCTPNQLGTSFIEVEDEEGTRTYSGDDIPC